MSSEDSDDFMERVSEPKRQKVAKPPTTKLPQERKSTIGASSRQQLSPQDQTAFFARIREADGVFGTVFWVKFGQYPYWPARLALEDEVSPQVWRSGGKSNQHCVYFFGEHSYGWVRESQVQSWAEHYAANSQRKMKGIGFV